LRNRCRRRVLGELPAAQRLHDYHAKPLLSGFLQAFPAGLIIYVHIIVLNLAEIPGIVTVQNLLEHLKVIMKGKAEVAEFAFGALALGPIENFQTGQVLPLLGIHRVQQIKIDVVGLQALELRI